MRTTSITTITCDECGKTTEARGITGWYRVERHPLAVDTRTLHDPDYHREDWDLCSAECVGRWSAKR